MSDQAQLPEQEQGKADMVYEPPTIIELGDVDQLTFGPGGTDKDSATISHDPGPVPAIDWPWPVD